MADDVERLALGGDDSPWAHDLPIADPAPLPTAWVPAPALAPPGPSRPSRPPRRPDGLDEPGAPPPRLDAPTPGHRHRRTGLVIGLVGLLAATAIGSQVAGGGGDGTPDGNESGASVTSATSGNEPSTTPAVSAERARSRLRPTSSVGEQLPEPPPEWVTSTVELDPRVTAIAAPTQLVALRRDGTLFVIDTPTGAMRSIDSGMSGINLTLSLAAHDVMLSSYDSTSVALVRPDVPPVSIPVDGGVSGVIEGSGQDDFVLVPGVWDRESPAVLRVGADARPVAVSTGPLVQFDPWQIQFLHATGQMIVNDSGGVYLVGDDGSVARASTGDLVYLGRNHFVVRECDDVLVCNYVRVDQVTGERTDVDLGSLDLFRSGDLPSTSLSPDGTALSYFDWSNGGSLPVRRLFDLTTGTDVEVVSADQYNVETAWAADSSGMFVVVGRTIVFYDRSSGTQIPVAPGLDDIIAVATRPLAE